MGTTAKQGRALRLVPVLLGKVRGRAAVKLRRFRVPLIYRSIRYPDISGFRAGKPPCAYFFDPDSRESTVAAWRRAFDRQADVVRAADQVCDHIFDLLGSGPVNLGDRIDWHTDFKCGESWPSGRPLGSKDIVRQGSPSDVKVPWELSRFQHVGVLGKAYWLTGDERYAREFVDQVTWWIDSNPWGRGVNWACAMDVAIRAANWILGYHFFLRSPSFDASMREKVVRSLWEHGWFLETNLEVGRINSNHYLSDLAGLFAIGVFLSGGASDRPGYERAIRWRDFALAELISEMRTQVLEDGADYEKSTSYHRLVLELFTYSFLLAEANGLKLPPDIRERWERMFEFVLAYTKPDGFAPQMGDSDDGVYYKLGTPCPHRERALQRCSGQAKGRKGEEGVQSPFLDHRYLLSLGAVVFDRSDFAAGAGQYSEEAFWFLGPESRKQFEALLAEPTAPLSSRAFPRAGFYVLRSDRQYAIIDAGDNGTGGLGGHGHCDALSFELYAFDKTFIVDPGTYLYTADPEWRNRFRSTAYHNTVAVDGEEIHPFSERWLFTLPDAGEVRALRWDVEGDELVFEGEHDTYRRLKDPVLHRRAIRLDKPTSTWRIGDSFTGSGLHSFDSRLHFAPGIDLREVEGSPGTFETVCEGARLAIEPGYPGGFESAIEDGWYSPSYGIRVSIKVLRYSWSGEVPCGFAMVLSRR